MKQENLKVLIIDDDKIMRDLFCRLLEFKGYKPTAVTNGADGLKQISEETYDIAFLDMVMPGMGGLETYKKIREKDTKLPVIMMTGYAVEDELREALKLGAFDYLYKPCDISEIMAIIRKVFKKDELKQVEKEQQN